MIGIFKNKKSKKTNIDNTSLELVTVDGNGFFYWDGKLFKSDVIRSIIRPKVRAIGKLDIKHIRGDGENLKTNPELYLKFLLSDPNPLMSMQMLLEKMVTQLELNGNAFAVIQRDIYGLPNSIYPMNAYNVEAIYKSSILYLRFSLKNGNIIDYPYSDVIHIRKDFNENDIFGTPPKEALQLLMDVVGTTDQGIIHAVRNSNVIKWMLKFKSVLKEEDIKKEVRKFVNSYLKIGGDEIGAGATDPRYDAEQVKYESYVPNAPVINNSLTRLYNFFNTNEKIIQSKFNENEWISYFESEIEPLVKQLSEEFTRKLFTRKERSFGNKIIFDSMALTYASMSTKLQLGGFVDKSIITRNELRTIMNLPQVVGLDEFILRKDTGIITEDDNLKGGENDEQKE